MTDPDATGPISILRNVPPMPPPDRRPAPPPRAILPPEQFREQWFSSPTHDPLQFDLRTVRPGPVQIEIVRPFRTAWAVGLGLVAAGWTVTLGAAAIIMVALALGLAALVGAG